MSTSGGRRRSIGLAPSSECARGSALTGENGILAPAEGDGRIRRCASTPCRACSPLVSTTAAANCPPVLPSHSSLPACQPASGGILVMRERRPHPAPESVVAFSSIAVRRLRGNQSSPAPTAALARGLKQVYRSAIIIRLSIYLFICPSVT